MTAREHVYNVRASAEEVAELRAIAEREGIAVSELMRRGAFAYGKRNEEARMAQLGRNVLATVAGTCGDLLPHPDPVAVRHQKRMERLGKKVAP